jgi:hypothetical protein
MSIVGIDTWLQNFAKGYGALRPFTTHAGVLTTAAAAASGSLTLEPLFNAIGTVAPGTLVSLPQPGSADGDILTSLGAMIYDRNISVGMWLGYLYVMGTLDPTATGDKFTHDAATFPVLRTQFGQVSKPVTLHPTIYVTTAVTGASPAIRLRTNAGAAGYVNQDGASVVGTRTFTFPATPVAQSMYEFMLEDGSPGDTGVRDITKILVDTACTAGAMQVFGFEPLIPCGCMGATAGNMTVADTLVGSLRANSLKPAVATAGTVTAYLCVMLGGNQVATASGWYAGAVAN